MKQLLLGQLRVIESVGHVDQEKVSNLILEHLTNRDLFDRSLAVFSVEQGEKCACCGKSLSGSKESREFFLHAVGKHLELLDVILVLNVVINHSLHD